MINNDISKIYDIKFIDQYDRFVNASIQRDYKERTMIAMSVLLSCCGLISQVKEQNEGNRHLIMSTLVIMTGLYAMHRINKIMQEIRFLKI
jgi:hypothetical protein